MPIVVPPFTPYQAPLIPIRGLWNNPPPEGDRFISAEIDWGITTGVGMAVQFAITGFSPVEFSQIVALNVDNGRNGSDTDFLFPDTGRQLTVPGYCQGLFPVISNSMMFYVMSAQANVGDITCFEILNSLPPPVSVLPSQEQSHAGLASLDLSANATTTIVPAPTTGTVQNFTIVIGSDLTSAGSCTFALVDGQGNVLWTQGITLPPGPYNQTIPVSAVRMRFINGLSARVTGSTLAAGQTYLSINLYYSVP